MEEKVVKEITREEKTEGIQMTINPNVIFSGIVTIGVAVLVVLLTKSFTMTDRLSKVEEKVANMGIQMGKMETNLETRINKMETKMETRINRIETKMDKKFTGLDSKIDSLKNLIIQRTISR